MGRFLWCSVLVLTGDSSRHTGKVEFSGRLRRQQDSRPRAEVKDSAAGNAVLWVRLAVLPPLLHRELSSFHRNARAREEDRSLGVHPSALSVASCSIPSVVASPLPDEATRPGSIPSTDSSQSSDGSTNGEAKAESA